MSSPDPAEQSSVGDTDPLIRIFGRVEPYYQGGVPYDRVIQVAREEFDLDRASVESGVETLVEEGVLRKVNGDRLEAAPVREVGQ